MQAIRRLVRQTNCPLFITVILFALCLGGCAGIDERHQTATPSPIPGVTATSSPEEPAPAETAQWTIMIYMCGDNDLRDAALADFNEMEAAGGSTRTVRVVTQLSLPELGTRRYLVEGDSDFGEIASHPLAEMGTRNMANPRTLSDFVLWAAGAYPAHRYALIIWNHGLGWPGSLIDQTAGDELSLPDLVQALNDAKLQGGPQFLDVIGFDAGLMAQWEVFDALAPYGEIAVASQEAVPATGWDYTTILAALRASPAMDGRALAEQIAQAHITYYGISNPHPFVTLSAVKLADIGGVSSALSALVQALAPALPRHMPALTEARVHTQAYAGQSPRDLLRAMGSIDLQHFADLLTAASEDEAVRVAARAVATAVDDAVLLSTHDALRPHAGGVAAYFPADAAHANGAYAEQAPVAERTGWAALIKDYWSLLPSVPAPTLEIHESDRETVTIHDPARIEFDLLGPRPEEVSLLVGAPVAGGALRVLAVERLVITPALDLAAGEQARLFLTWDARTWSISDGLRQTEALLWPSEQGSLSRAIRGEYVPKEGQPIEGCLFFDSLTGRLEHVWAFREHAGSLAPFEILPRNGDSFIVWDTLLEDSGNLRYERGTTLRFADLPFAITQRPAKDGDYALALRLVDIAGRITMHREMREVANGGLDPNAQGFFVPEAGHRFLYPADWTPMSRSKTSNQYVAGNPSGQVALTITALEQDAAINVSDFLREYVRMQRDLREGRVSEGDLRYGRAGGAETVRVTLTTQGSAELQRTVREVAVVAAGQRGCIVELSGPAGSHEEMAEALDMILASWQAPGEE